MFPDLIGECNDAIECVLFIERMAALYLSTYVEQVGYFPHQCDLIT